MASSSCLKPESMAMNNNNIYITPEATYEAVVADPKLFMSSLERLHFVLGTKFMVPVIGGKDLDLHKLFVEVTSRGGINKILHERRWKEVTATFVFPPTATNASFVLRKYYFSLLNNYEQIYFFKSNFQIPSSRPALIQETMRPPSQELQPKIEVPLTGSNVMGVIDGKFETGYLVTVTMGSEQLKGVLYQLPQNTQGIMGAVTKRRRRRKKSEIKRRDPAHPKPNRSGYNFFFAEQHARLKSLHPGKDREISRMIGEFWNKLNEQEKSVYQGKANADKDRYLTELEDYRERLRTGQLISNAVPLQQKLPEQNIDIVLADLPTEEAEEEDGEGDSSDSSGESEPHDEFKETFLNPSSLNLKPNPIETVVAEKTGDVVMETAPMKKAEEPTVVMSAAQN